MFYKTKIWTILHDSSQGFGFVEFEDYRDADDAVYELNGKDLLGERWVLYFYFLLNLFKWTKFEVPRLSIDYSLK